MDGLTKFINIDNQTFKIDFNQFFIKINLNKLLNYCHYLNFYIFFAAKKSKIL